jgi:group II intron reverse transcriptase/maturase
VKAAHDKRHRFENLYRCLNEEHLLESWRKLNKQASAGVDRVTAQEYGASLQANLHRLVKKLTNQEYRTRLIKRKYIPKANGKQRPLGIPVLEDRLLQSGAASILSAIYEEDFLPNSFGYRPGRGSRETSKALAFNLQKGRFGYVVEADIKGFFDHLQHDWLMKMLELRIQDGAFLGLIDKWLKGGILETDGRVNHPESGTPQGGVISPILANIYLHYVLDLWFEKVVKRHCRGQVMLIRYADDFVCAFEYESDARRFYEVLPKRLAKFGLSVAPEKTRIHRFSRFQPSKERRFCFLGYEFYWEPDSRGIARVWRRTAPKKLRESISAFKTWVREHRHESVQVLMRTTKQKLTGHYNYFGVIGNHKAIVRYHGALLRLLHKWLNRRSQRRGMTWEKLERLVKKFNFPVPRCTEPKGGKIWVLA